MQIDVSERIDTAKRITREWAERAGYKQPLPDADEPISKRANDIRRILGASSFGCQERNVHLLVEAIIGEKIPEPKRKVMAEYLERVPFAIGSILVPVRIDERTGIVTRTSQAGNAGLRKSNGEMHNSHYQQNDVRPATDEEIEAYFSEFFGVSLNEEDAPAALDDEPITALAPPEPLF